MTKGNPNFKRNPDKPEKKTATEIFSELIGMKQKEKKKKKENKTEIEETITELSQDVSEEIEEETELQFEAAQKFPSKQRIYPNTPEADDIMVEVSATGNTSRLDSIINERDVQKEKQKEMEEELARENYIREKTIIKHQNSEISINKSDEADT